MKQLFKGEIPSPDTVVSGLWTRIPSHIRLTFVSAFVLGFVAHLYQFTNKLPNHDDIGHLFTAEYGTASGRWLLPTILKLDGNFSIPWLIGVLSLLFLALTACFTVSLLRIRTPAGCIVTAGLLVSFPTVAATFSYMFTSDAYFFALSLAAFGAYATVRFRGWLGVAVGAAAVALSMGIYQSYFGVAAVLMVGALIFETLDGQYSFRELIFIGIQRVCALGAGMVIYILMVKWTTRDIGLVDYMGISSMGSLSLRELPSLIFDSYNKYLTYFWRNDSNHHPGALRYFFLLTGLCSIVLLVLLLRRKKLGGLRTALALVLAVLYPLAGNIIYVMVSGGGVHSLMLYGMVFLLIAPLALIDYASQELRSAPPPQRSLCALAGWIILFSMALTSYSYMILDNKAYLKLQLSYEQSVSYSTRLISAIESCKGYHRGMSVALVGSSTREAALSPTPQLNEVQLIGVFSLSDYRTNYTYGHFLRYYLGYTDPVYLDGSELVTSMAELPQVQAMPTYPEAGSIQVIDNVVVVKLNAPK